MDAKDFEKQQRDLENLTGNLTKGATGSQPLKRELDSIDDFEHLEHDISPLKEAQRVESGDHAREFLEKINSGVVADSVGKVADSLAGAVFDPHPVVDKKDGLFDTMDSNLLDMANTFPDRKEADAKLDKFLSDISTPPSEKQLKENVKERLEDAKAASQNFMDMERGPVFQAETRYDTPNADLIEKFSDSEPEDEYKPSKEELKVKDNDKVKTDIFKDFDDFELPKASAPVLEPVKAPEPPKNVEAKKPEVTIPKEPEKLPEPIKPEPPKIEPIKPIPEVTKKDLDVKKEEIPVKTESKPKTQAEAIFCDMGLVADLIYWRDPKKSGPVFGGVLIVLLALTYFSLISVVAYLSLLALTGTISFRIYKNVVQAVQKTGDGHPFKEVLDTDLSLPQSKVEEITKVGVAHFNAAIVELRRLFLVEDLVDSIKFGVLLWCLTYLGAWFNGMTLIILAWVALFTFPKIYEANKTQIDANLDLVRNKLDEITSKVKAAIPIGKKVEDKKQQ